MFDFERLELYQVMRNHNKEVMNYLLSNNEIDPMIREQWKRSTLNALLNLTEGVGRVNDVEKKQYFAMARGAIYEGTALMQLVRDLGMVDDYTYVSLYATYEQVSKMLLGMYRSKSG
jgi:four helix bundle protein